MSDPESSILLIGGGHSHCAVLADWIEHGLPASRAIVVTPSRHLRYSGMVPGWIAGEHSSDAGLVDIEALAKRAGAEFVQDRCVSLDPIARKVLTAGGKVLPFDIASIDTGGVGKAARALGDDPRILDVRPIDRFVERLTEWREQTPTKALRIAVIGGGAGGVELAFGLRNLRGELQQPEVTLVTGRDAPLPGFNGRTRRLVQAELARQGIDCVAERARIDGGQLCVGEHVLEPTDIIVAALGSGAPDWPKASGLAIDDDGFIAVDQHQRSLSHPHIFAAGDVASRRDTDVPHSGVHAVHAGPVLAANLRAVCEGKIPPRSYIPRPASLYLLSTGNGSAIAAYGILTGSGRWASKLKGWIDKRWVLSYAKLADKM